MVTVRVFSVCAPLRCAHAFGRAELSFFFAHPALTCWASIPPSLRDCDARCFSSSLLAIASAKQTCCELDKERFWFIVAATEQYMTESKLADRILLALVFVFSLLPIAVQLVFVHFYWPLIGGQFFNPIDLSAYIWLVLAVIYYRRNRTRMAAGVFILFPVAFAFTIVGWLFRYVGAHHGFGR